MADETLVDAVRACTSAVNETRSYYQALLSRMPSSTNVEMEAALRMPRSTNVEMEGALRAASNVNATVNSMFSNNINKKTAPEDKLKGVKEKALNTSGTGSPIASFSKEVIMCRNSTIVNTLDKEERKKHRQLGLIINSFSFSKHWSETTIKEKLGIAFQSKQFGTLNLLVPEGSSLEEVICHNTDLNGVELCRLFARKAVYLRTSIDIDNSKLDCKPVKGKKRTRTVSSGTEDSDLYSSEEDAAVSVTVQKKPTKPKTRSSLFASALESNRNDNSEKETASAPLPTSPLTTSTMPSQLDQERTEALAVPGTSGGSTVVESDHSYAATVEDQIAHDYSLAVALSEESRENEGNREQESLPNDPFSIIKSRKKKEKERLGKDKKYLTVSRTRPMESLERYVCSKGFDIWKEFHVKFAGEAGVDTGGPKREFLDLVISFVQHSSMFRGEGRTKSLALNLPYLQKKYYFLAGVAIALTSIHGGPAAKFLSKNMFDLIVEKPDIEWSIGDIDDVAWLTLVTELKQSDPDRAQTILQDPLLKELSMDPYVTNQSELNESVKAILQYYFEHRLAAPLKQLTDGLSSGGFRDMLRAHPDVFQEVFVGHNEKLTSEGFKSLCKIHRFPIQSSSRFGQETEILANWDWLLNDLEEGTDEVLGQTLEMLLAWITGCRTPPIGGYEKLIDVYFMSDVDTRTLPEASSCALNVYLPLVNVDYENFKKFILMAMTEGKSFEKS